MVVVKDDRIVDEYYKDGYDETSVFRLYSCSKSVISTLMGIAIDKGLIDGGGRAGLGLFPPGRTRPERRH